jgi:hypothetical protein
VTAPEIPIVFFLHPVGIGATRAMNVLSAKLWIRALVEILPDVTISAPWLPYAEVMVDRERGMRDAFACIERHDAGVAVGGDFSRGMIDEWARLGSLKLPRIDLTRRPMPPILTYETFAETQAPAFRQAITEAFRGLVPRRAAA